MSQFSRPCHSSRREVHRHYVLVILALSSRPSLSFLPVPQISVPQFSVRPSVFRGKRRFRVLTSDSKHSLPIAPNVLDRKFSVGAPNQVWVGDLTYIPTEKVGCFLPS